MCSNSPLLSLASALAGYRHTSLCWEWNISHSFVVCKWEPFVILPTSPDGRQIILHHVCLTLFPLHLIGRMLSSVMFVWHYLSVVHGSLSDSRNVNTPRHIIHIELGRSLLSHSKCSSGQACVAIYSTGDPNLLSSPDIGLAPWKREQMDVRLSRDRSSCNPITCTLKSTMLSSTIAILAATRELT